MIYPTAEELLRQLEIVLGEPCEVRDLGLLESATARPQATAFGVDAYPDIWGKAAALFQSLVTNHALVDGNKRLGWLGVVVFLYVNGITVRASQDDAYIITMAIAAGQLVAVDEIASELRRISGAAGL